MFLFFKEEENISHIGRIKMENKSALKKYLCQLEKRLLEPEIRTTPAELEKLLADDFFE
jgi:hypothetical protein